MRLYDMDIIKLLPEWMREQDDIKGLAKGTNKVIRALEARLRLISRWDRIDQLDDKALDEMAWDLNIPWYSSTAPLETKRAVIKSSDLVYAKLGTRYAVEQIIADYFGSGEMQEWDEYDGKPYHFKIVCDDARRVNENLALFMRILNIVKRKSAVLDSILVRISSETNVHIGMAVKDHTIERHDFSAH